jgi:hypothetical protein
VVSGTANVAGRNEIINKEEVIMPRFDQTGPDGEGAMTGRKNGICTGKIKRGEEPPAGYGRGRGWFGGKMRGSGRGHRARYRWFADENAGPDNLSGIHGDVEQMKKQIAKLEEQLAKNKK